MAAAEVLAVGITDANSADQIVVAGTPVTFCLKDAAGPSVAKDARVQIKLKDDGGEYFTIGLLNSSNPVTVIYGPGTYRFSRIAGGSCGVFSG